MVAIGDAADDVAATFDGVAPGRPGGVDGRGGRPRRRRGPPGDAVLLSPGCASFDWYPDGGYPARGDDFRRLVHHHLTAGAGA